MANQDEIIIKRFIHLFVEGSSAFLAVVGSTGDAKLQQGEEKGETVNNIK